MRKLLWTIAIPLGLLALAIIAHVAMRTPGIKPYTERVPASPADTLHDNVMQSEQGKSRDSITTSDGGRGSLKQSQTAPPKEPPRRYTICGIAGAENCRVASTPIR